MSRCIFYVLFISPFSGPADQEIRIMGLSFNIQKPLISFELDVSFTCKKKRLLVLIGPSGAGKTMLMRHIAGLERPKTGRIVYENQTWVDMDKGVFLPPQSRCVGYIFQDYPLFPHLNMQRNVAFAAGSGTEVEQLMKDFDVWDLRHRKPHEISGGERQRCAICQVLARQPQILLLDEPFSALDVITRRALRDQVIGLKSNLDIPMIYVTHDINEALAIADDILPIVNGRADHDWIQQPVERDERGNVIPMKAARRPRLSLAY
jgi:molybdate transport system ATP-binding protein